MADTADTPRQMPNGIRQPLYLGGTHDYLSADLIPEPGARRLQNADVFGRGSIRRRGGITDKVSLTSSTGTPLFLMSFPEQFHDTNLVALTGSPSYLTVIDNAGSLIELVVPIVADSHTNLVKLLNRVYVLSSGNIPFYWQYGNLELLFERGANTGMPISNCATVFQSRAYAGYRDLLYFSLALGNTAAGTTEFTWDQQFQAFRSHTGNILQLLPFRSSTLLIFTEGGIEALEPNPCDILESTQNVLSTTIGLGAFQSPTTAGEDVYFVDRIGHVRSLQQTELDESKGVTNTPISLPISNVIARVNLRYLHTVRVAFHDGIYWVFYPVDGATTPNEGWGYSIRDQAWVGPMRVGYNPDTLQGFTVGGLVPNQFDGEPNRLYLLHKQASTCRVDQWLDMTSRDDRDVEIATQLVSRNYSPSPEKRKVWNHLEVEYVVDYAPQDVEPTLTVEARGDEGGPWVELASEGLVTDAGPALPQTLPFSLTPSRRQRLKVSLASIEPSYSIQLRLSISDAETDFRILGTIITYMAENINYHD